jgi:hypothetical protein
MPTPKRLKTEAYWDREWELEKARGKNKGPYMERERARDMIDKMGIDRKGKHVDHKTAIKEGGKTTKSNIRVVSAKTNLTNKPKRGKQISNVPKLRHSK